MSKTRASSAVPILAIGAALCFTAHCGNKNAPRPYRGQSGSEVVNDGNGSDGNEGASTVPCPCGRLGLTQSPGPSALLRVHVLARDAGTFESSSYPWCRAEMMPSANEQDEAFAAYLAGLALSPECARLRLRIDEVLLSDAMLQAGEEIDVVSDGYLPCFVGTAVVGVGGEAFAAVSWPPESSPEELPSARLAPWEPSIVFAKTDQGQLAIPVDELPDALLGNDCRARFGDWAEVPGVVPSGNIP